MSMTFRTAREGRVDLTARWHRLRPRARSIEAALEREPSQAGAARDVMSLWHWSARSRPPLLSVALADWQELPALLAAPTWYFDDYTDTLLDRDAIEFVIAYAAPALSARITPLVVTADAAFMDATRDDTAGVLESAVGLPEGARWWWRRGPSGMPDWTR